MSMEARDSRLDEEMRKVRAAQAQLGIPDNDSDADEKDEGTFEEYKTTNPTPSNSPIFGRSKPLTSTASSSKKATPSPSSPKTKSSPSTAVITPSSASAPALTPTEEGGIVGKAADTVINSAKGLLGAIWGMGDGASSSGGAR